MSPPPLPDGRSDGFSLALLSVIRVLRSVAAGLINLMFPYLILVQLGYGALVLGLVYTVATVASGILGLLLGFAADLVGRKRMYLAALALLPLSTLLLLISQSLPFVFLSAALGGYSATGSLASGGVGGVAAPIQSALMTDLTSRDDRTFYFGLLAFLAGVAAAGGAFLAGLLGTSDVLELATVLGVASSLLGVFIRSRNEGRNSLRLRTGRVIGKFSLTGLLNGASQGLVTPFLIPFFILVYNTPQATMGLYTTASGLVASFSLLLGPRIERSLGFLGSIYATRGSTVLLALLFPLVTFLPVSLAIYLAFPSLRVMAIPVQQTAMMDMIDAGERGRAFGINQATRLLFSAVGTGFTGYEFHVNLIYVPFLLYAAVMTGNLLLYRAFFQDYAPPERK